MNRRDLLARGAAGAAILALPSAGTAQTTTPTLARYTAGWSRATGGQGGRILKVTTLASDGEGSFKAAALAQGPRIIVFEVGGVIDLQGETLRLNSPDLTIAGQTAPSPGITLIRGGMDIATNNVIIRHIRVRPGEAGAPKRSGRDFDSISAIAARDVIVDHCSLTWGTDENLSASGPRFTGTTPEQWRAGTSQRITFSNNLIAEGLSNATHAKGEHSKGSLIHDNASDILIYRNVYAHNMERNPLFKGGVRGAIVNNLIYNPGTRAIHYNLMANEWGSQPFQAGQMTVIGNSLRGGINTDEGLPLVMLGGHGDLRLFLRDNIAQDLHGNSLPMTGTYTSGTAAYIMSRTPLDLPAGLEVLPARRLEQTLLTGVGARPWDRDAIDVRILADIAEGRGHIINSEADVGGYPVAAETRRPFDHALWNLATMEPLSATTLDSGARARGT
jgi:hypothetical protein